MLYLSTWSYWLLQIEMKIFLRILQNFYFFKMNIIFITNEIRYHCNELLLMFLKF